MNPFFFRSIIVVLIAGIFHMPARAEYPVSAIPEALLKKAKLIKRADETFIEVRNIGKAIYRRHYVYTVLNEAAEEYAALVVGYDKFRVINDISGTLYDAGGKKLKSVKKKDIQDGSGTDGSSLITDGRYKYHNFYYKQYPYTVAYDIEVELNGIFYFPEWMPQSGPQIAVENSKFVFETPKDYALRYKMFHYTGNPLLKETKNTKILSWELGNVPAREEEAFAPEWNRLVTRVLTAPSSFEIGGYKGSMETWQQFGKFMTTLYAGRDVLPAGIKTKVRTLIAGLKTEREKIDTLYRYMQQHSRYISIQLGMGGWQPLDATYVAEKKYGDCKALSNYMVALLKEAGIRAYSALINGGMEDKDLVSDFPSNQFNHVIVCVPGSNNDPVWLECTSQTVEPGYMGGFTGNREALLIDDTGSRLVRTPAYQKQENVQNRLIDARLDENGTLVASVVTRCTGLLQDDLHHIMYGLSDEEKQKRLRNHFSIPNYEVSSFGYQEAGNNVVPAIMEKVQLVSKDYAVITGKRLFIKPNILSANTDKLTSEDKREHEIVYEYGFVKSDTVSIKIPPGYTAEAMPRPVTMENGFGAYAIRFELTDGVIRMIRRYDRNSGHFPASDYEKMVAFYNTVYTADRSRIVLVKKAE
ncbi:DUF3857 domain-containing protein [Niabella drilacis]|uniref:Transglutaminase-like superfamily protein n=1 Tax=Niabella drilacis (strain DSM 25811 / CCM 8410 / CCUG 62505 / LMG 26954 / E90) TaxID=1285928 RepID=A0A1G6YUG9_NIADE|nr:DUF3857 and transglutaminase domain-containing protein [Niabella drilacis]SDD93980.1 Transglutaminase-like superfamily protein [Niabella drilacis]